MNNVVSFVSSIASAGRSTARGLISNTASRIAVCLLGASASLLLFIPQISQCAEATYTYNIAPSGGPDAGKTTVSARSGALSTRSNAVTRWDNSQYRLRDKTITVTYDLGAPNTIVRLKARSIVPPWCNFAKASFSVSLDGTDWTEIGSKPGYPSHEVDRGSTRTWEFEPQMNPVFTRYIRYEITPAGFVHPTLSDIVIVPQVAPAVARSRDHALSQSHGFYRADIMPPSHFAPYYFEKWRSGDPAFPDGSGPGGFIKMFVHNDSSSPWQIDDINLSSPGASSVRLQDAIVRRPNLEDGGLDESKLFYSSSRFGLPEDSPELTKYLEVGDPVWYSVEPNPVPAYSRAEVTIRCRLDPRSLSSVTVSGDGRSAQTSLSRSYDGIRIASFSFSYDIKRLYVYVERSSEQAKPLELVLLDGKDVWEQTSALQREWNPGGVAGYVVRLPESLEFGSFHTLTVVSGDGKMDTAQIRARDAFFPICMFGPPLDEEAFLKDISRNYFNSMAWANPGPEKAIQYGLRTFEGEPGDPTVYGSFIYDEPDVKDYFCPELPEWSRLGTLGQYCAKRKETTLKQNPAALQMLNLDNTYKPLNWMCYAQLGDIIAHDPYWPHMPKRDPMCAYANVRILTENARPKPTFTLLFAGKRPDIGYFPRFLTSEEVELQNAYALAAGTKGISYWWYRDDRTVANNPTLMRAMGRVNARVRQVSEYAANGIPTDWAKADVPGKPRYHPIASGPVRVWCATIWSPDGLVLFVCNNEYIANEEGFTYKPIKKVPVVVQMPDGWTDKVSLYEVTDAGTSEPKQLNVKDGLVRFTLDSVNVSRWFVIKP